MWWLYHARTALLRRYRHLPQDTRLSDRPAQQAIQRSAIFGLHFLRTFYFPLQVIVNCWFSFPLQVIVHFASNFPLQVFVNFLVTFRCRSLFIFLVTFRSRLLRIFLITSGRNVRRSWSHEIVVAAWDFSRAGHATIVYLRDNLIELLW